MAINYFFYYLLQFSYGYEVSNLPVAQCLRGHYQVCFVTDWIPTRFQTDAITRNPKASSFKFVVLENSDFSSFFVT